MENDKQKLEQIKEKYQARNKYINDYMKNKYDRVVLLLPKGYRDIINNALQEKGYKSANEYFKALIDKETNTETTPAAAMPETIPEITPKNSYNPALYDFDDEPDYIPPKKPIEYDYTLEEQLNRIKEEHNL